MTEEVTAPSSLVIKRAVLDKYLDELTRAQSKLLRNIKVTHKADGSLSQAAEMRAAQIARAGVEQIMGDKNKITYDELKEKLAECKSATGFQVKFAERLFQIMRGVIFTSHAEAETFAQDICQAMHLQVEQNPDNIDWLKPKKAAQHAAEQVAQQEEADKGEEKPESIPLTEVELRTRIRSLLDTPEMSFARSGRFRALDVTITKRLDLLTDAAMTVLAPKENGSLPSWKAKLTNMAKPGSDLAVALKNALGRDIGLFPTDWYSKSSGNAHSGTFVPGGDAGKKANELAKDLCGKLREWVETENVTVARADPNAPATEALAKKLGASKRGRGHARGGNEDAA